MSIFYDHVYSFLLLTIQKLPLNSQTQGPNAKKKSALLCCLLILRRVNVGPFFELAVPSQLWDLHPAWQKHSTWQKTNFCVGGSKGSHSIRYHGETQKTVQNHDFRKTTTHPRRNCRARKSKAGRRRHSSMAKAAPVPVELG